MSFPQILRALFQILKPRLEFFRFAQIFDISLEFVLDDGVNLFFRQESPR